jgi:hypothetical protein
MFMGSEKPYAKLWMRVIAHRRGVRAGASASSWASRVEHSFVFLAGQLPVLTSADSRKSPLVKEQNALFIKMRLSTPRPCAI